MMQTEDRKTKRNTKKNPIKQKTNHQKKKKNPKGN